MLDKERFYFDTAIWLDFYEERDKRGEYALRLMEKIILEEKLVLYSNAIVKELKKLGYLSDEIEIILSPLSQNIRFVHITKSQIDEAERVAEHRNIPKKDALHAILARDNEAILITRDYHFQKLKDITIPRLPEEII